MKKFKFEKKSKPEIVPQITKRGEFSRFIQDYANKGDLDMVAKLRSKVIVEPILLKRKTQQEISKELGISRRSIWKCLSQYDGKSGWKSLRPKAKGKKTNLTEKFKIELIKLRRKSKYNKKSLKALEANKDFKNLLVRYNVASMSKSTFYRIVKGK